MNWRIKLGTALVAAFAFLAGPALAQAPEAPMVTNAWLPMGKIAAGVNVTNASAATQLPAGGDTALVCNTGSVDAYLILGTSTVTASVNGSSLLKAGNCWGYTRRLFSGSLAGYIAAITASSSTTFSVEVGLGTPPAAASSTGGALVQQGTVPWIVAGQGTNASAASQGVPIQDGKALAPASLTGTGTLLSVSDTSGYGSISVQVTSAGVGATITYQVSDDGANWVNVAGFVPNASASTAPSSTSSTATLIWFPISSKQFRAQVTAYVSGTVTAQATLRKDPLPQHSMQVGLLQGLNINQVGGFDKFVTVTPTVQNAAYASGNVIGGLQSVTYFRGNAGTGILNNILITSKGGTWTSAAPITLYVFQSNPSGTTCTDKTAFSLGAADIAKMVAQGPMTITPATFVGSTATFGAQQLPVSIQNNESTSIFYVCPVVGGSGFTPASTTDLVFNYAGTQD